VLPAAANTRLRAPSDYQAAFGALPPTQGRYQGTRPPEGPIILHVRQPEGAIVGMLPIDDLLIPWRENDRTRPNACVAPSAIACMAPPSVLARRDEPRVLTRQPVRCSRRLQEDHRPSPGAFCPVKGRIIAGRMRGRTARMGTPAAKGSSSSSRYRGSPRPKRRARREIFAPTRCAANPDLEVQ
jgi:hypothetical protein